MRQLALVLVGVSLLATLARTQARTGSAADEAAIKKNTESRTIAWNKHDAKAIATTYAADADRATPQGYFSGRAQVEKSYGDRFLSVNKNATLKAGSEKIRFLGNDVAVDDRDVTISGRTDGTVKNHVTDIFQKRNGQWELVMSRTIQLQ